MPSESIVISKAIMPTSGQELRSNQQLDQILQQYQHLKGQLVLTEFWTVEQLVAIVQQDQEYFYVTFNGKAHSYHSCLDGRIFPLKEKVKQTNYQHLLKTASINFLTPDSIDSSIIVAGPFYVLS